MLEEVASRSGCGDCEPRWVLEGVDRVCVDLAGKVVVGVTVCVKMGSKVCSEDGFESGC